MSFILGYIQQEEILKLYENSQKKQQLHFGPILGYFCPF